MTERDVILEELHELELLIRAQEKAVLDYPSKISLQLGLASLRNREESLIEELKEVTCLQVKRTQK